MANAQIISQGVIFRDSYLYCSHPHAIATADGAIVAVFNQTRRNLFIFHPPHDPQYRNFITRSTDLGTTWSAPQVAPNYECNGTECASLTQLASGRVLLNQWCFRWYPLDLGRRLQPEPLCYPEVFVRELIESAELETGNQIATAPDDFAPWARGHGDSFVHLSDDGGRSFLQTVKIDTGPFHGGYGLRGCLEFPDGTLLLPLNNVPDYHTIFTVTSHDGGASWREPQLVAFREGRLFTEPAMVLTAEGDIVCMIREDATRIMHVCRSADGGSSWSDAEPTGIAGYPPHLLRLADGRLLCSFGMRQPEYSIQAVLSEDHGKSWQRQPVMIRRHLPNRDLGYPASVLLADGSLFTVYYCQDAGGVTGVEFTRWRL
ncbi:MAG: exo-alpha-sialidase [Rhizobiales bacterium]|nr:exo-alpha-sialidase [Hyphomicrobiales bacterium]